MYVGKVNQGEPGGLPGVFPEGGKIKTPHITKKKNQNQAWVTEKFTHHKDNVVRESVLPQSGSTSRV
jgi:hypothetical protein